MRWGCRIGDGQSYGFCRYSMSQPFWVTFMFTVNDFLRWRAIHYDATQVVCWFCLSMSVLLPQVIDSPTSCYLLGSHVACVRYKRTGSVTAGGRGTRWSQLLKIWQSSAVDLMSSCQPVNWVGYKVALTVDRNRLSPAVDRYSGAGSISLNLSVRKFIKYWWCFIQLYSVTSLLQTLQQYCTKTNWNEKRDTIDPLAALTRRWVWNLERRPVSLLFLSLKSMWSFHLTLKSK